MTAGEERETLRLKVTEPEEHVEVLQGDLTSRMERGGIHYHVFSIQGSDRWLAIRPRHGGSTIDEVFTGKDVIVNIARPEKDRRSEIPPTETQYPYSLEFFAIGILSRGD